MLTLYDYLVVGAILFCLSIAGIFLNRKNVIILLMAIELMLLAVNMNFVAFSHFLGDLSGQIFVFFILTVAAAEAAIGLAILVVLFRNRQTIDSVGGRTFSVWPGYGGDHPRAPTEASPRQRRCNDWILVPTPQKGSEKVKGAERDHGPMSINMIESYRRP